MMPRFNRLHDSEDRQYLLLGQKFPYHYSLESVSKDVKPSSLITPKEEQRRRRRSSKSSSSPERRRYIQWPNGRHQHCLNHPASKGHYHHMVTCHNGIVISKMELRRDPDMHLPFVSIFRWLERVTSRYQNPKSKTDSNNQGDSTYRDHHHSSSILTDKYNYYGDVLYSNGSTKLRLVQKKGRRWQQNGKTRDDLFAVKIFTLQGRGRQKTATSKKYYLRRITSEFCIAHSLRHPNVVETIDLLQTSGCSAADSSEFCQVMEYCDGGSLFHLLQKVTKLDEDGEADCFFKQLLCGVKYLHRVGVSHRNLKPENLLLTGDGVLKISDFGCAECFKMPWQEEEEEDTTTQEHARQKQPKPYVEGVLGTVPYMAPEVFTDKTFDPMAVDMWSVGIIYFAMRTGRWPWRVANEGDGLYQEYLKGYRKGECSVIELVSGGSEARYRTLCAILHPNPKSRLTASQALESDWIRGVLLCEAARGGCSSMLH